jgi:hypothetical protein
MDNGFKDAEPPVIHSGPELYLFLARIIKKGLIAALFVVIVAAVLMFGNGVSMRTAILLGGALLSPLALFACIALILKESHVGRKPGIGPMLIALGGFVPFVFGSYLVFYEGFWGFIQLLKSFTLGALFADFFYVIAGYYIVLAIYHPSEFAIALDEGRIAIRDKIAD